MSVIDVPVTVDNGHSFHRNTFYLSPLRTCRSATVCFHVVRCPLKVIDAKGLACQHRSVVFLWLCLRILCSQPTARPQGMMGISCPSPVLTVLLSLEGFEHFCWIREGFFLIEFVRCLHCLCSAHQGTRSNMSEQMGDSHRRFLQTMMTNGIISEQQAKALYRFCCETHNSESFLRTSS